MSLILFIGHMSSVKIYRRVEHPKAYPYITLVAFILTFILYNVISAFTIMTFGADIDPDMLNSYPAADIPMYFGRLAILGCVTGAYPVFTLLGRKSFKILQNFEGKIILL